MLIKFLKRAIMNYLSSISHHILLHYYMKKNCVEKFTIFYISSSNCGTDSNFHENYYKIYSEN